MDTRDAGRKGGNKTKLLGRQHFIDAQKKSVAARRRNKKKKLSTDSNSLQSIEKVIPSKVY